MDRDAKTYHTDKKQLSSRRYILPTKTAPSTPALGIRFKKNVTKSANFQYCDIIDNHMEDTVPNTREQIFIEIFYFLIIPILLLYFNVIPINMRLLMLLFVCVCIYAVVRNQKWSAKKLGVMALNRKEIIAYTLFTIATVTGLFFIIHMMKKTPPIGQWWLDPTYVLFFIPVSFLQEFAFRSFLFPLLRQVYSSPITVIAVNTILFTFLHIIYRPLGLSLSLSIASGVAFAAIYYKYPNYWLISISHSILNFIAVLFGFFLVK